MIEIWKPIKNYEGYYEISNLGRVKSVERYVKQGNFIRHVKESIKNEYIGPYGYPCVTLCKDRKSRCVCIHIILAHAFIPNPENKTQVDHINTDRTDYRLENLRWVTPKENSNNELTLQHCKENTYSRESLRKRLETRKSRKTLTSPKTIFQYSKEGTFIKEFYSFLDAERELGINNNSIRRALDDNTKSAGGYLWSSILVDDFNYNKRISSTAKPILQFDLNGNLIKEWASVTEAANALNLNVSNIIRNIKSNSMPKKYKFKYKKDVD